MNNLSNWISGAALITVVLAGGSGFRAWGQQETKIEQLVKDRTEDRAEQKALRDELTEANKNDAVRQEQFKALLKELERLNRRLGP